MFSDVAVHCVPDADADENLETFRRACISTFTCVHIPHDMVLAVLRVQRPFLWLVVMTLATKAVSLQFAMEETIWNIISTRIVAQQHASLDLLLGLICFASWYLGAMIHPYLIFAVLLT